MVSDDWTDTFEVYVSRDRKQMLQHIAEWSKKNRRDVLEANEETIAICCPTTGKTLEGSDAVWESSMFATLFFNKEELDLEVIIHECGHAAFARERFVARFRCSYGPQCNAHEERYVNLVAKASDGVVKTLRREGLLK
jgi:hypothetical protein